jgi:hypothetical protein
MHFDWIITVFILTDMTLARLEQRSHGHARVPPERWQKFKQNSNVCYDVSSGPHQSIRDTTVIFL